MPRSELGGENIGAVIGAVVDDDPVTRKDRLPDERSREPFEIGMLAPGRRDERVREAGHAIAPAAAGGAAAGFAYVDNQSSSISTHSSSFERR